MMKCNLNYDLQLNVILMEHENFIEAYHEDEQKQSICYMLLNGFLVFDYNGEHVK